MKLSFSTLACPDWDWPTIRDQAVALGFSGIEVRGVREELEVTRLPEFSTGWPETRQALKQRGLEIVSLDSSVRFAVGARELPKMLAGAWEYIELAARLGVARVRVFPGRTPEGVEEEEARQNLVLGLQEAGAYARAKGVWLLVETHDDYTSGVRLAQVLREAGGAPKASDPGGLGAVWDAHHPWRFDGELPRDTARALGPWVKLVHLKDSRPTPDGYEPCLVGDGDVPLGAVLDSLAEIGYDGYLSCEYEKRWNRSFAEPEVALPHFARHVRGLLEKKA